MARTKTTKITRLFTASAYDSATEKNYEGAPTFTRSPEESLVRVLTTGTFEPTFYASDVTLADEALALFREFAVTDPHFLAQAIVYARTEGLMRLAPITALVVLSASPNLDAKEMFRRIFPRVIQTPGDMQDFVALCRGGKLRGMGKSVTHAVARWLSSMSEYHAVKYGAESQRMSLRDLYRLSRPKLAETSSPYAIARAIVKGDYSLLPADSQLRGYEAFKAAAREGKVEEALALVSQHHLPWEVVAGQFKDLADEQQTALWRTMLYQMPFMACLAEGTPIWLPDGTTAPIEDVVERKLAVLSYSKAWDTRPVSYTPLDGPKRDHNVGKLVSSVPSAWLSPGVQPVKTIRFRSGRMLDATRDHRWIAQRRGNGRKSWEWRTTEELLVGDHIPAPLTADYFGPEGTADDGYFVGAMLGDGGMTSVTPEFHGDPTDGAVAFMRSYAAEHECRVIEIPMASNKIVRLRFPFKHWKRNPLAEVLRRYDVWGLRCETKALPNLPFSAEFWIGCLSGLIDTDGCVRERHNQKGTFHASIEYVTVSRKLAQQVSDALLRFGIMNRIRTQMRVAKSGATIISRYPLHFVEVARATAIVRASQLLRLRVGYKAQKLHAVAQELAHIMPTISDMYGHDPSVGLDQIVAIEDGGEKAVYCVEVGPSHLFVANGIVTGNCLRNLNNLVKYHVTDDLDALDYIVNILRDPERVAHSKQLPFRFYSAIKAVEAASVGSLTLERIHTVSVLQEALQRALELSFANMPELGDSVLIANDISGSMGSKPSPRSDMTMAEIAGVFAAAAFKKARNGSIVSFNEAAHPRTVKSKLSLANIAKAVAEVSGGTSLSAPLDYAFGERSQRVYDTAIFITDSESWYDHLTRQQGALDQIREYKRRMNPRLVCFFVQLVPYKHAVAPQEEPGCYYLYGWNASTLSYIAQMREGGQSQIDAVKQVSVL